MSREQPPATKSQKPAVKAESKRKEKLAETVA
jgi:hypothetical protein